MKISINTPCHENWDGMTPNEKGAFCLSCQKNVVDFSKKTVTEIKSFFTALPETESVCGRFEEDQLEDMTFDHFHNHFKKWHYFQKAAVIMFFIFGFSLFGGAQNNNHHVKMGIVAYVPQDTVKPVCKKDTTKTIKRPIKGKVKFTPEERPKKKNPPPPPPHVMGDVMIDDRRH